MWQSKTVFVTLTTILTLQRIHEYLLFLSMILLYVFAVVFLVGCTEPPLLDREDFKTYPESRLTLPYLVDVDVAIFDLKKPRCMYCSVATSLVMPKPWYPGSRPLWEAVERYVHVLINAVGTVLFCTKAPTTRGQLMPISVTARSTENAVIAYS